MVSLWRPASVIKLSLMEVYEQEKKSDKNSVVAIGLEYITWLRHELQWKKCWIVVMWVCLSEISNALFCTELLPQPLSICSAAYIPATRHIIAFHNQAVVDARLRRRVLALVSHFGLAYTSLTLAAYLMFLDKSKWWNSDVWPLSAECKHNVIHKPEVGNISPHRRRKTELRPQLATCKLDEVWICNHDLGWSN